MNAGEGWCVEMSLWDSWLIISILLLCVLVLFLIHNNGRSEVHVLLFLYGKDDVFRGDGGYK